MNIPAVIPVIDDVIDTANKAGSMGMQTLILSGVIMLMLLVWYLEKERTKERMRLSDTVKENFNAVVGHHSATVAEFRAERAAYYDELRKNHERAFQMNERSVVAIENQTAQSAAILVWLKEHQK